MDITSDQNMSFRDHNYYRSAVECWITVAGMTDDEST